MGIDTARDSTDKKKRVSAIVLAGGRSRRFNFVDKGLVIWKGQPLIQHVVSTIKTQVDEIILSCNQNVDQYRQFGYPIVLDELADFQGPLAGIQAALPKTLHPYVLICPCDTTQLPSNLVEQLLTAMLFNDVDATYAKTEERNHYLPVLMKTSLQSSIDIYLKSDGRSMKGWYRTIKHLGVPFSSQENEFSNFNHRRDLEKNA
ncbi:MAG: molybdenum cofactor guanylyltransferase MobA [Oceanicoccus sp.]